jgi:DNA-binding SARP family transcriptional activator/tetratricopeptide (TPR) repeat protein
MRERAPGGGIEGGGVRGLRVLLLGRPRLEVDGQALADELPAKHRALLFRLAAADGALPRAELAALLWEDLDESAARGNLRTALMRLRRALPDVLEADAERIGFAPGLPLQVDRTDLARAASGAGTPGERLAAARAWRGPLLEGFTPPGDAFEHWLAIERTRTQRQAVGLWRALAEAAERDESSGEAEGHWRALLEIDDSDEPAHMALMRLLAASGRRTAAIAQYEACRAALQERLGARPSAGCYALYTRIHADTAPPSPPPPPARDASPGPVPGPLPPGDPVADRPTSTSKDHHYGPARALPTAEGPLIGRDGEIALILERMSDPDCRWLTLVGPGGVGKTRLVIAAAGELRSRFRHGVLWLTGRDPGGPLRDAETLAQHVVARTGADRDRPGSLLLLLDNLETVPDVPALARGLHARAPGVRVLATSRRRLATPGEWLLELPGLSLVRRDPGSPASSPAASLLAAAVRRVEPRFDPVAEADRVERLCERVDGLPLALELAARGVLDTGLAAVLARVEAGAPLEDAAGDVEQRHHSIEVVTLDAWSLLPPPAREAALRIAWLPDAFDPSLAEGIGVGAGEIATLREQSWLRRTAEGALALHPLQQDFLRRLPAAAPLRARVRATLADLIERALPALPPFADWPSALDRDTPAGVAAGLAARPLFAASVLAEAVDARVGASGPDAAVSLARWVDAVVALLHAADRHAEAASILERACRRTDLPAWRLAGWRLQRAGALNNLGDALTARREFEAGLAGLSLDAPTTAGGGWRDLPAAVASAVRRHGWPADAADRAGLDRLLTRALASYTQVLSFSMAYDRSIRANVLATVLARRNGNAADRASVRIMTAFGMLVGGRPRLARATLARCAGRPLLGADPVTEAFSGEGECAVRIALGQWRGLPERLLELIREMDRLNQHRHAMECHSLLAKLYFYEGRLAAAAEVFAETTERAMRRLGGAWRAWGPFGEAEVALCRGDVREETLRRWVEIGSHWLTELNNTDAAYVLRRAGLVARLEWRRGDTDRARDAVLGGVATAMRIPHCGFWAHEGFAGIGEVLLQLMSLERRTGGVVSPLQAVWRDFDRRLRGHEQGFPAGRALAMRLRGEAAHVDGRAEDARRWLMRAVTTAEAQGLRVELARSCEALARMDREMGDGAAKERVGAHASEEWQARAGRLWTEMRQSVTARSEARV